MGCVTQSKCAPLQAKIQEIKSAEHHVKNEKKKVYQNRKHVASLVYYHNATTKMPIILEL